MAGEVGGRAEALVAHRTDVVPLVGVAPQVDRQGVFPTEGLPAESTPVGPGKGNDEEGVVRVLESEKFRNNRRIILKLRKMHKQNLNRE